MANKLFSSTSMEVDGGDSDGYELVIEYSFTVQHDSKYGCNYDGMFGVSRTDFEDVEIEDLLVDGKSVLNSIDKSLFDKALQLAQKDVDNRGEEILREAAEEEKELRREARYEREDN